VSLLSRLLGKRPDDRLAMIPLWHRTIAIAREQQWYADFGVADTVAGRFDAVTLVLALVLLRMEGEAELAEPSVRLTELFVDDMDGQLRESGVGDLVVGKHIGRLMSVLGGRLGALRDALPRGEAALAEVITRNVTLVEGGSAPKVAAAAMELARQLDATMASDLLAGRIAR
jgi:cytochrome b pre-mRNA-processing protein 3